MIICSSDLITVRFYEKFYNFLFILGMFSTFFLDLNWCILYNDELQKKYKQDLRNTIIRDTIHPNDDNLFVNWTLLFCNKQTRFNKTSKS